MNHLWSSALVLTLASSACVVGESAWPDSGGQSGAAAFDGHDVSRELFGINVAADGGDGGAAMSALGAAWARVELVDPMDGTELSPDSLARVTGVLADYHAHGVKVLVIAGYSSLPGYPGFTACGPRGDWDAWRAAWLARLAWTAGTLGDRVDAWEVWNEEDHPVAPCAGDADGYNPGMPAATYGALLRDAYGAIRGGSGAPVVIGGLDSGQVSYVSEASSAAGGLFADGIGIHPYGVAPSAAWCPDPGEDLHCEWGTLASKVADYGAVSGLPVWITELGIRTTDADHQARYLEGAYRALAAEGTRVATAFYFCYSDAMVAPFGLLDTDGYPKGPAVERYRALSAAAQP